MTYRRKVDIHLDFDIEFVSLSDLHTMLGSKNAAIAKYAEQILDTQANIKELSFKVSNIAEELNYLKSSHRTWRHCIEAIRKMEAEKNA